MSRLCPPLELALDEQGRRLVPLQSLRHVLEWQLQVAPEEASLEKLLEAVGAAEEAPLPGVTPARADLAPPADIPGLSLAEPRPHAGSLLHPDTSDVFTCSNCRRSDEHESWCPVGQGPIDPLAR